MSAEKGLVQLLYTFHFSYSQGLGVIDWWLIGLIATNISIRKYSIIVRCLRIQSTAKLSDTELFHPPINTMHYIHMCNNYRSCITYREEGACLQTFAAPLMVSLWRPWSP